MMTHSETLAETAAVARHATPAPPRAGRKLTSIVAAVAVASGLLAGTAIPARADGDDLAKALAAIAVVGLIASAAKAKEEDKQRERDRKAAEKERKAREKEERAAAATRTVPTACGIEIAGTRTSATVYSESCMAKRGVVHLPVWCARPATILGKRDFIYTESCLREGGLRLQSRR